MEITSGNLYKTAISLWSDENICILKNTVVYILDIITENINNKQYYRVKILIGTEIYWLSFMLDKFLLKI